MLEKIKKIFVAIKQAFLKQNKMKRLAIIANPILATALFIFLPTLRHAPTDSSVYFYVTALMVNAFISVFVLFFFFIEVLEEYDYL